MRLPPPTPSPSRCSPSLPALSDAQADHLPFGPGERLTFQGRVHTGVSGGGTLWVEGPVDVRGTSTWLLHSDMEGRVGPLRATDRNASWLDPIRMTALRYTSRERHILLEHDDAVDIFPASVAGARRVAGKERRPGRRRSTSCRSSITCARSRSATTRP